MQRYRLIKVFTNENAKWQGKPVGQAMVEYLKSLKIPVRCIVTKGMAGYYEDGEIAMHSLLKYNLNLPIQIEVILPARWAQAVLPTIAGMVVDGIIAVEKLTVYQYKVSEHLIPDQILVKDVMTAKAESVGQTMPVEDVIRKMLSKSLKSVPVVDNSGHPVGMITQENLSNHPYLPLRLGLLARLEPKKVEAYLDKLPLYTAGEIMSYPVITVRESQTIAETVELMLRYNLKRLPVVNDQGRLSGVIARIDIFRIMNKQADRWQTLQKQQISLGNQKLVRAIHQRENDAVSPETSLGEVIAMMDRREMQRVAVVDQQNRLVGIISDYDLLPVLSCPIGDSDQESISPRALLTKGCQFPESIQRMGAKTVADLMNKQVIAVQEEDLVETALQLMTEKGLKRLPVTDAAGIFHGMITRDDLLRVIAEG